MSHVPRFAFRGGPLHNRGLFVLDTSSAKDSPVNQPILSTQPAATGTTFGQWMALLAALLGWMFDGFELGLLPLVARPALQDLLADAVQKNGPGLIDLWEGIWTAGFLVGMSTGGVLFGWLGDRIGRVRAMTLSVFAYSVFSGVCCLSRSAEEFFCYRFLAALGMGGEWSLGVALVMEIWPNKSRALLSGLIGAAANVGFLLVALFALGLASFIKSAEVWLSIALPQTWVSSLVSHEGWRLLMLLGAVPAVLTFFIRLAVPESEKWQHQRDKGSTSSWATKDLLGVVLGAAGALLIVFVWLREYSVPIRVAGSLVGLVIALFGYIYPVLRFLQRSRAASQGATDEVRSTVKRLLIGACLSAVALIGTWASIQRAPSWANDLGKQAAIQADLPVEEVKAAGASARAKAQIFSGLGAIVGTIVGALMGNVMGRRPTFALLCLGSFVSALVFFQTNTTFGMPFLVTVFVAGGMTASFYGWLPLYLPELFRTNVRATAQGFAFNFGRILAAVAALQTGNMIGLFKGVGGLPTACSVMSLVYVVGMAIIWLAPETKGQPLPE